jgi:tetratricopeptide (TPR) repeat protein
MTDTSSCEAYEQREFPRRYAAGTLDPTDAESYEAHFLTCERCRDAVAFALSVRDAARATPATAPRPTARRTRWLAPAGLALAAGLALFAVVRIRDAYTLRALGALYVPPAYRGIRLRANVTTADSLFHDGMTAYVASRYDDAVRLLQASIAALPAGADSGAGAAAEFFLGASLLVRHQPASAGDAFARVIAAGWSPYRDEAHYYRALALLQTGHAADAATELQAAATGSDSIATRARALLVRLNAR